MNTSSQVNRVVSVYLHFLGEVRQRLRDALYDASLSIAQAFNLCGMDYNSYYTALFKKHIGLMPNNFGSKTNLPYLLKRKSA